MNTRMSLFPPLSRESFLACVSLFPPRLRESFLACVSLFPPRLRIPPFLMRGQFLVSLTIVSSCTPIGSHEQSGRVKPADWRRGGQDEQERIRSQ